MQVWKQVKGYEGLYEVSNFGNVKSLARFGTKGKIMNARDNGKGYYRIKLTKNNKEKMMMLHRIIAEAFIPNVENKRCVNHINGIKTDNRIENLEWCTHSENRIHAINIGLVNFESQKKGIKVLNTETKQVYESITEVCRLFKIDRCHLSDKLKGKIKNKTKFILFNG